MSGCVPSGVLDWGYSQDISIKRGPLFEAWQQFLEGGAPERDLVRPVILEAWQRCRTNGVNWNLEKAPGPPAPVAPGDHPPHVSILLEAATPPLLDLARGLEDKDSIAALCDQSGRILAIEGDSAFAARVAEHKNFRVGIRWSEEVTGNNAIGTALSTGQPHQVFSAEHYCRGWHDYVCTAVPIYDPFSEKMLGVLDITGTITNFHRHAYGQVLHVVRLIETALFRKGLAREYLFNREVLEAMNSVRSEALVVADVTGAIRVCTDAARERLQDFPGAGEKDLSAMVQGLLDPREPHPAGTFETVGSLAGKTVRVRVQPMIHNRVLLGAIVRFPDHSPSPVKPRRRLVQQERCPIIGNSPALTRARLKAEKVAPFDSTVLLEGESGTGKELFARLIHNHSRRSVGPFIALNCAAIPPDLMVSELFGYESGSFTGARAGGQKGKLEMANRGTLFLDEISEMPLSIQVILLRFIQEKEFYRVGGTRLVHPDVRVIAATNKPLRAEMAAGRFRKDLFYRLKVVTIELPPLRQRREDIPLLVEHFLGKLQARTNRHTGPPDQEAMTAMAGYRWPGNVRELQNAIEHALVMSEGDRIHLSDLPEEITSPDGAGGAPAAAVRAPGQGGQRDELLQALQDHNWNISLTARSLGLARATLYRRMKRHGISVARHLSHP